ncbi:hypothetical protein BYT27DRAFT_7244349 [Phlegmacium glaucopus]|nr:hypothetical protein BYT27DRAFT_7244349 [Phlegmacium glaucopus]
MSEPTALNLTNEAQAVAPTTVTDDASPLVEKVVTIDGKEAGVKVANTHSQARRVPKVTFCCQEIINFDKLGSWHYAKIFLPKTHEEARAAAVRCFGGLLTHTNYSRKGELRHFGLKVSIRRNGGLGFAHAHILDDEWWEIMNELIEENPDLEVAVVTYKD